MENEYLRAVQKLLSRYTSYFKTDNILVVSEEEEKVPFAYIIYDESRYKGNLLLSLAVDFSMAVEAVEVAINTNKILAVVLAEPFYISKDGHTYFNKEAYSRWNIETMELNDLEPTSDKFH